MVGFTRKKVNSQTLGEKLKGIRENSGVSLNEIAKATKVRKVYLEMLENGEFEKLPPDVYVRGFLNSYARYLGIEAGDVMKLYEKERGIHKNIKKFQEPREKGRKFKIPSITITPKVFAVATFAIFIIAGITYFYKEIGKFSQEPRLVVVQPSNNLSVEGNSIDIVGISEKDTQVTINGQPVFVNESGEFKETISLQQGLNELEVKAVNKFDNEAKKKINVSALFENDIAMESEEERVMGAKDEKQNETIKLEVKIEESPTWISVEVDDKGIQSGTMLPGAVQIFEATERISVTSGKANKTIITLNSQELGPLGDSMGVVRDVIFTRDTNIIPEPAAPEPTEEQEQDKKDEKKED